MRIVLCGRGESRVKPAVEVRIWKVASSMNLGASGSRLSPSPGSLCGFLGGCSDGVGRSIEKLDRARPRRGWCGMLPAWVVRVMLVL